MRNALLHRQNQQLKREVAYANRQLSLDESDRQTEVGSEADSDVEMEEMSEGDSECEEDEEDVNGDEEAIGEDGEEDGDDVKEEEREIKEEELEGMLGVEEIATESGNLTDGAEDVNNQSEALKLGNKTKGFMVTEADIEAVEEKCETAAALAEKRLEEIGSLRQELDDLREWERRSATELQDRGSKITEVESENTTLKAQLEKITCSNTALQAEKEELESDLVETELKLGNTALKLVVVENELQACKVRLDAAERAKVNEFTHWQHQQWTQYARGLKRKVGQLRNQLEEYKAALEQTTARVTRLSEKLRNARERIVEFGGNFEDTSRKLAKAEDELKDAKTQLESKTLNTQAVTQLAVRTQQLWLEAKERDGHLSARLGVEQNHCKDLEKQFVAERDEWAKEKWAYEERIHNYAAKEQEQLLYRTSADEKWEMVRRQFSSMKAELDEQKAKVAALEEDVSRREVEGR